MTAASGRRDGARAVVPSLADVLSEVADEVFEQWDKGMKSGKLLTALAGRCSNYDPRITAIRAALASPSAGSISAEDLERAAEAMWGRVQYAGGIRWENVSARARSNILLDVRAVVGALGLALLPTESTPS